jgi:hypothetical protein
MKQNKKISTGDVFKLIRDGIDSSVSIDKTKYTYKKNNAVDILYNTIDQLEGTLIASVSARNNKKLLEQVYICLENIADLIESKQSADPELFNIYIHILAYLNVLISECSRVTNLTYMNQNFSYISALLGKYDLSLGNISKAAYDEEISDPDKLIQFLRRHHKDITTNGFLLLCDNNVGRLFMANLKNQNIFVLKKSSYFVDVTIRLNSKKTSDLYKALWMIHEGIEKIDKVKIVINGLKVGSILEQMFIWADDLFAKEEVKYAIGNSLTKVRNSWNDDAQNKKKKTKTTTKKQKAKTSTDLDEYQKLLEIEIKTEELKAKKLQNIRLISDIIKTAIIETDEVQIEINGISVLRKIGNDMHVSNVDIEELIK